MQGIYTYIPETNYVPREYSVVAILLLIFMVLIALGLVLLLLLLLLLLFCIGRYANLQSILLENSVVKGLRFLKLLCSFALARPTLA